MQAIEQNSDGVKKIRVAILGTGNIGTDLLIKVLRSPHLDCSFFLGQRFGSAGMKKALDLGVKISDRGINAIMDSPDSCDLVFDCTSSEAHKKHWPLLERLGKHVIDLTPAKAGKLCVPAVNMQDCLGSMNLNMVSCGGQTSIPLAYVIGQTQQKVEYIEVVSTIAARSAGPGTRRDIDEYIHTTELGLRMFSGCSKAKAILNLNPAVPPIDMQTTIFAQVKSPNMESLRLDIEAMVEKICRYVPGYQIIVPPIFENGHVVISVKVQGMGDYLQKYAGNLDIINCAALYAAEEIAQNGVCN